MKRKTIAVTLFAMLGSLAAFGFWSQRIIVEVPFDYYVSGVAMPAGTYLIDGHTQTQSILFVRNIRGTASAIVATRPEGIATHGRSELLFHRYGNTYFLARVTDGVSGAMRRLPVSDQEKELVAQAPPGMEVLALVVHEAPLEIR